MLMSLFLSRRRRMCSSISGQLVIGSCTVCKVQLLAEGMRQHKLIRPSLCYFIKFASVCQDPNLHTDILCSVTTGPGARRPIPEQRLAYVWALCSSAPTQKAGGPCSHEGQVVSSGISPRLSHSLGDRCKQLHLHAELNYNSKERLT